MSLTPSDEERYGSLESVLLGSAQSVRPPERLTVSESAAKYRYMNNPGSYVGQWKNETTPYLVDPMDVLPSHEYDGMIFVASAQSGKALAIGTPIATSQGWATMGSLRLGDFVFGSDGKPVKVIFATRVMTGHKCFRVVFDDGREIVADEEHKWSVVDVVRQEEKVITTGEMRNSFRVYNRNRYSIPLAKALQKEVKELLLDPYIFGLWLGDGNRVNGYISVGRGDIEAMLHQIGKRGFVTKVYPPNARYRCFAVEIRSPEGAPLSYYLSELGVLGDKRVPFAYLHASVEQRRELLRGLMDSDGCLYGAQNRTAGISQSNLQLADSVEELMLSLGHKVRRRTKATYYTRKGKRVAGKVAHVLTCATYDPREFFSLPRKVLKKQKDCATRESATKRRFVVSVEEVPSQSVRCIRVDSDDHLFLAGKGLIPTHNTDMFINWLNHTTICDPADMMLIQTAQATARDFSIRRVDRFFRQNEMARKKMLPRRDADNTYDKRMSSGMIVTLSWPSINELSGRPIPRLWLTDYDRMTQDVNGEGTPYALAKARSTTFGSHAMVAAESSPGFLINDPLWVPKTKHEAPPTEGILALYNSGDRRRWYWWCVKCNNAFEPAWVHMVYPKSDDPQEAAEDCRMVCPHCGQEYRQERTEVPGKNEMNQLIRNGGRAIWIAESQRLTQSGELAGEKSKNRVASFWLQGVASVFNDWKGLVTAYLAAEKEYEETGSEQTLKTVVNTKLGLPYLPKQQAMARLPETLKSRAKDYGERVVPWGVRFLVATVDVQKNRFVVQVHGIGDKRDVWIVDRFDIKYSKRYQKDAPDQLCYVNPGAYQEDWYLIQEQVMLRTYPLMDTSGKHMPVRMTFCDSGGREGVTQKAYEFVRWVRSGFSEHEPDEVTERYPWTPEMEARFQLVKGDPNVGSPRMRVTYPDSQRRDRNAGARGEIPVMFINVNVMKNTLDKTLDRMESGGRINFPKWLSSNFYKELTVESKNKDGKWENPNNYRNESWDLLVYCLAGLLHPEISIEVIDWADPPVWAQEWETNELVFDPSGENKPFEKEAKTKYDLASLAKILA